MVNESELSDKHRKVQRAKGIERLEPKGKQSAVPLNFGDTRTSALPVE
jgi:hypothetical protein